jgi:iron complex outermembrane receptor protein
MSASSRRLRRGDASEHPEPHRRRGSANSGIKQRILRELKMASQRTRYFRKRFWAFSAAFAFAGAASTIPHAVAAADQAAGPATSTTSSSSQLDEIIVTAQKREQRAIDTPLSVTALDANSLAQHQVQALEDLQSVSPGVQNGEQFGGNRLFIRGIGLTSFASGADPSSAFYVDGVYIARPAAQLGSFYDVERVEVLRGPQGALYGRNATAGAVNLITNAPTAEFSGYLDETIGNYDLHRTQGALSGPLNSSGTLLGRVAFDFLNRGGYGYDFGTNHPINDANRQNARITLEYKPNDKVDLRVIAEFTHDADNDYYVADFGAYPGHTLTGLSPQGPLPAGIVIANSQNVATNLTGLNNKRTGEALTANLGIDLNDNLHFTSITGGRHFVRFNGEECDGTSAGAGDCAYNEWDKQFSQEFNLNYHDERWNAIFGANYFHENLKNFVPVPFPQFTGVFGPGVPLYEQVGEMPINAFAVYAQGTYSVMPSFRVTVGGRYSSEKRSSTGFFANIPPIPEPIDQSKTWTAFNPKVGFEYDVAKDVLWYASATNGFKSGTFDVGQINPAIDPEKIWAYETGLKGEFLDRRLEFTSAIFYYNYTDLQVNKIIGLGTLTVNAAKAKNKGIELSTRAKVTNQFTVEGNITYLDAKFTQFNSVNPLDQSANPVAQNLAGNLLPGSSKVTADLALAYQFPLSNGGSITAHADALYSSRIYFSEFNEAALSQDAVTKINAQLRYESPSGKWYASLWGKNITNELVATSKILTVALWGYPIYGSVAPPATYGVEAGVKF